MFRPVTLPVCATSLSTDCLGWLLYFQRISQMESNVPSQENSRGVMFIWGARDLMNSAAKTEL